MEPSIFSPIRRALARVVGQAKAEAVKIDPSLTPANRAARARQEQLVSGAVPDRGRGSCGGTTPLPQGKGWRPHNGRRQKLRGLRQTWVQFEKLCAKDSWANTTRERLLDAVLDQPEPELSAMNIVFGAKVASDEKKAWLKKNPPPPGVTASSSWTDALNHALNEWERIAEESKTKAVAEGAAL